MKKEFRQKMILRREMGVKTPQKEIRQWLTKLQLHLPFDLAISFLEINSKDIISKI